MAVPAGIVVRLRDEFAPLEARIGYRFKDVGLLEHALTHRSRAHEDATGGVFDNESMEFLGDAVLGFVIADRLFRDFPQHDEGRKSKLKAWLVSAPALAVRSWERNHPAAQGRQDGSPTPPSAATTCVGLA